MTYFFGPSHAASKRNGTRVFCKKCQKEEAFFRNKCLVCGTAYAKQIQHSGQKLTYAHKRKLAYKAAMIRNDRIDSYRRAAEESRKKFEGSK